MRQRRLLAVISSLLNSQVRPARKVTARGSSSLFSFRFPPRFVPDLTSPPYTFIGFTHNNNQPSQPYPPHRRRFQRFYLSATKKGWVSPENRDGEVRVPGGGVVSSGSSEFRSSINRKSPRRSEGGGPVLKNQRNEEDREGSGNTSLLFSFPLFR